MDGPIAGDATPGAEPVGTPVSQPETYTVTVDGVDRRVSLDELTENFSKGEHFTQKSQALAEKERGFAAKEQQYEELREMATGLASRPDIIAEVERMWEQQPQQQPPAQGQPGQQYGATPQRAPQVVNPQIQELQAQNQRMTEMYYEQQAQQEALALQMKHPEVDIESIYGIAADNPGINLETAYELQQYRQQQVQQAQAQANAGSRTDQSPATGMPPSGRPDPNDMTDEQMWAYVGEHLDDDNYK